MTDFFKALADPDIPFLRYAFLVGLLSSISLGIVGSYVVTRRITYIAAAIAHCVLGGIGAALYLDKVVGWTWCDPMYGATAAAILSALVIGLVSLYAKQREDTVISAVWAMGMAVGVLFLSKIPAFVDPMSYLFGDILLISRGDLWMVAAMDVLVVAVGLGFYNKFLALCFDEEYAELRGVRAKAFYLVLLCLTALTVVLLVRVVGIVLVIALLTLPPAVAGYFSRQLWQMMLLAVLFCAIVVGAGIAVSYPANLPSGPVIILLAGTAYLLVAITERVWRNLKRRIFKGGVK
jgi:zinc transport system permease protein